MIKSLYAPSKMTIGRYRTVALDPNDKMLSGRNGWIFLAGQGRLGVVLVTSHGNEKLFYCDFKDLEKWVLRIDLSIGITRGAYYANNPNARHD